VAAPLIECDKGQHRSMIRFLRSQSVKQSYLAEFQFGIAINVWRRGILRTD